MTRNSSSRSERIAFPSARWPGVRLGILLIALSTLLASCGFQPCPPPPEGRAAQAHRFASLYSYELERPFSLSLHLRDETDFKEFLVHFRSFLISGDFQNDVARGFHYRPGGPGPYPAVIIVPRFGAEKPSVEQWLARGLMREGFAVFVLVLPWHLGRKGEGPGGLRLLWQADAEKLAESLRQAVLDVRRAIEWLSRMDHIDGRRIGILGISLGAFIANVALAIDDRLVAGVSVLGGGDLARAVWQSPLALWQRWQLRNRGFSEEKLAELLRPYDPLTFANPRLADRLYMINGRFDFLVGRCSVEEFWQAAGRPPITWLNSDHFAANFWRHKILRLSKEYLANKLAPRRE